MKYYDKDITRDNDLLDDLIEPKRKNKKEKNIMLKKISYNNGKKVINKYSFNKKEWE